MTRPNTGRQEAKRGSIAPWVAFLRTTPTGQVEAGRVVLRDGVVVFEDVDPRLVEELANGIRVGRRVYTPKDGNAFLRALPVQYTGSYLRAKYHER